MDEKDKQILELTEKLSVATKKAETADKKATELTKDLTAEKGKSLSLQTELDTINKVVEAKEQTIVKQQADLTQAASHITDLKTKLDEAEAKDAATKLPTVKDAKKVAYELLEAEFNYKGQIIDLARLESDPDLVSELVKEGVSFLRKASK